MLSPTEYSLRGRLAAYTQHSLHDTRETTHAARAAFLKKFEREVDPGGVLEPLERARRVEAARKAYFCRLSLLSIKAKRERAHRRKYGVAS